MKIMLICYEDEFHYSRDSDNENDVCQNEMIVFQAITVVTSRICLSIHYV